MAGHAKLQNYRHNYSTVCMTGLLGCRWHRYRQSTKGSRKIDIFWFSLLLLTFLFISVWLYYVLIAVNDAADLNEYMYSEMKRWVPWYMILQIIVSVLFSYTAIVMILGVCHIARGHQVYIHPVHLCIIIVILAACITLTAVMSDLWRSEWAVIYLSLQIMGPFLQIGAVIIMTVLSWIIAHELLKMTDRVVRLASMFAYFFIMGGLYTSPLFIHSPCVIERQNLAAKPKLFAHRGASGISPENTVISFEVADQYDVYGFETDVRMSYDGEPFLMHDDTLRRTTNVEDVFPDLVDSDPSSFNMSQLSQLNAGGWFLEMDPFQTVGSLSEKQKKEYRNQRIPTLLDLLSKAKKRGKAVIFNFFVPPTSHPYHNDTMTLIDILGMSGINQSMVYFRLEFPPNMTREYHRVTDDADTVADLLRANMSVVNLENGLANMDKIRTYINNNITVSVYMVDTVWLYSFYWCLGVDIVNTNRCDVLSAVEAPMWHLAPSVYLTIWITVDSLSLFTVLLIFIIQRYRIFGNRFQPEHMSLTTNGSAPSWGNKRTRRSMKEKLLMRDVQADIFDFEPEDDLDLGIESTSYTTVTAAEGRILSQTFQNNRSSYNSGTSRHNSARDSFNSNSEGNQLGFSDPANSGNGDYRFGNRNSSHSNGTSYQAEVEIT